MKINLESQFYYLLSGIDKTNSRAINKWVNSTFDKIV